MKVQSVVFPQLVMSNEKYLHHRLRILDIYYNPQAQEYKSFRPQVDSPQVVSPPSRFAPSRFAPKTTESKLSHSGILVFFNTNIQFLG